MACSQSLYGVAQRALKSGAFPCSFFAPSLSLVPDSSSFTVFDGSSPYSAAGHSFQHRSRRSRTEAENALLRTDSSVVDCRNSERRGSNEKVSFIAGVGSKVVHKGNSFGRHIIAYLDNYL